MLRVNQLSKLFTTRRPVKTYCTRIFVEDISTNLRYGTIFRIPRNFYSNKGKDGESKVCDKTDKKEDSSIQSHPSPSKPKPAASTFTEKSQIKLRECKPIDLNPCKPPPGGCPSKVPSIQDCPTPNLMSQVPEPKCPWDDEDYNNKRRKQRILWLGLLFTAVTLGAVWYIGFMDYKQEKKTVKKKKKEKKKVVGTRCSKRTPIKNPADASAIPKEVPYLLIGGGTASFSAFRAIKSADPTAKVLVVTNESFFPYMRPPLSKEIWFNEDAAAVKKLMFKQWNGSERSLFYEPDDFYISPGELMANPNGGVAVIRGWTITHLDAIERLAYLDDETTIHYDKCLIATGASPRLSAVFQAACADDTVNEKVKLFRNIEDFEEALEAFEQSNNIAIVGGGFLGSELACAMGRKDKGHRKNIYQIFREHGNMGKILPEYLSYWTTEKVQAEGVEVMSNTEVIGVKAEKKGLELTLNNGKTIYVDNVIVSVGVEPNTDIAEQSDLEVDPELGGFLVNTELQARTDLYVAGDCACFYDPKLGRRRIEHHDHAVVSGRLAGENMAGARKPYYHQSMFWSDLGPDVGYEAIGIVDSSLPTVGVFAKATDQDSPKAVVTATDEGIRSNIEEIPKECDKFVSPEQKQEIEEARKQASVPNKREGEDFGKGVIFYLRNDIVVGIVLWNVFNRMSIARQVLKDQKKYDDLNEVAKLFNIHEE